MLLLPSDEVHIWALRLTISERQQSAFASFLSNEEQLRAARFVFDKDRSAYVACRGVLRVLIGQYLGRQPNDISLVYSMNGKPGIEGEQSILFNVSHSGGLALIAFIRDIEIGVDLEAMRRMDDIVNIARRYFSVPECSALLGLPVIEQQAAFFRCWTRKEAYIKATGAGLAAPLDQFQVSLLEHEACRMIHVNHDHTEGSRWTLQNLDVAPGFNGAVAYRDMPRKLQLMPLQDASKFLEMAAN